MKRWFFECSWHIHGPINLKTCKVIIFGGDFNTLIDEGYTLLGFLGGACGKEPTYKCGRFNRFVWSLGQEDTLEEYMATLFSILAWRIPWQRSLADYSPWGLVSQTQMKWLCTAQNTLLTIWEQSSYTFVKVQRPGWLYYVTNSQQIIVRYSQSLQSYPPQPSTENLIICACRGKEQHR